VHDDVVDIIDGQPFDVALKNAVVIKWSGILSAIKDSQQVGVVVLRDGHVAWAVSNTQTENFACFMERIGMVPKDKLDEVVQKYRSLGKSKKLGALLEETGLISHATLRECLKAHLRAAISSMMNDPGIILNAKGGEMAVDTSLIFLLSEVFPTPDEQGEPEIRRQVGKSTEGSVLQSLGELPGYLYSLIASTEGNQLACHTADDVPLNCGQVLPPLLAWLGVSSSGSDELGMGKVLFKFVQGERGALFVHKIDAGSPYFLAVICDEKAKLGVVRHKMSELMPEVRRLAAMPEPEWGE